MKIAISYNLKQDDDEINLSFKGTLTRNDNTLITYFDNGVKNVIEVYEDSIIVKNNNLMTFKENEISDIIYKTPVGDIDLRLEVKEVKIIKEKDIIKSLFLKYNLLQGNEIIKNKLLIKINEI